MVVAQPLIATASAVSSSGYHRRMLSVSRFSFLPLTIPVVLPRSGATPYTCLRAVGTSGLQPATTPYGPGSKHVDNAPSKQTHSTCLPAGPLTITTRLMQSGHDARWAT